MSLLQAKPSLSDDDISSPAEVLLRLDGVSKTFPARRRGGAAVRALDPLTYDIFAGEFVAVVGPSGCGKSTLLSIIAGLEQPTEGSVWIDKKRVVAPFPDLGVVFQKDLLLSWRTALDNVLLQAEIRGMDKARAKSRALQLLELVGLKDFAQFYPHELSGGMRQRIGICRALLHDPSLLLMDEPFAALDALTRDQMALDFQTFWHRDRRTVFFITHNISEAVFLADKVMVMTARPGRIAKILNIALPRPRALAVRETDAFTSYAATIRIIFEEHGVLRQSS